MARTTRKRMCKMQACCTVPVERRKHQVQAFPLANCKQPTKTAHQGTQANKAIQAARQVSSVPVPSSPSLSRFTSVIGAMMRPATPHTAHEQHQHRYQEWQHASQRCDSG